MGQVRKAVGRTSVVLAEEEARKSGCATAEERRHVGVPLAIVVGRDMETLQYRRRPSEQPETITRLEVLGLPIFEDHL